MENAKDANMEVGAQEAADRIIILHTEKCTIPYFVQNRIQNSFSNNTIINIPVRN